jgi:hypothetical protein
MNPEIRKFLQELLRDAGQTGLGSELENQMIEDLYSRLEDRLIVTALSCLDPDQRAQLEELSNQKSGDLSAETDAFFRKNIPDYDQVFARALVDFRNLYISAVRE